jgi:hypothetical protein
MPVLAKTYVNSPLLWNYVRQSQWHHPNWILYQGIFRLIFVIFRQFGIFAGMVITAIIIFLGNYFWNKKWSLSVRSQILRMNADQLSGARCVIEKLIKERDGGESIRSDSARSK